jgi:glycerol-3-phosphate dehydrogenase
MSKPMFDLAIIGGGINGCGIARDAAGRGLKVVLIEQDDLASATSSWSSKLIHGGLRYLEQYEFRLVREALQEREVLLKIAPHIIHPLEFILPYDASMRPPWMIRLGLFLYDRIGGKISLPGSRNVRFPDAQYSAGLQSSFTRAFFYSDARVDDARLTVLNAVSAREHGADVRVRTRVSAGTRVGEGANMVWRLTLTDADSNVVSEVTARGVVNAAGPWVKHMLDDSLKVPIRAGVKLVKGSHIVVPRVHDGGHAYILQNPDKRVAFVIPYEDKFSLIGTTDVVIDAVAEAAKISPDETQYLLSAVNRFLAKPLRESDIVWSYAGVRPLYDDGETNAAEITRDYVLKVDHVDGRAPLLSIFGGKITTYRRLAEHALRDLQSFFPTMSAPWTRNEALPGGDIESTRLTLQALAAKHGGLPIDYLTRLVNRYGSRAVVLLNGAKAMADLGPTFGAGANLLCEREIDFCIREEWARRADDILWRRTKCGLHMNETERARAAAFIDARIHQLAA